MRVSPPPTPQPTPCIIWQGPVDRNGYGQYRTVARRGVYAHRQAMIDAGYDVTGKVVMHLCDNPPCVNVEHLRLGTKSENSRDRHEKGRTVGNPWRDDQGRFATKPD